MGKGILMIISGPSGSGKGTVVKSLMPQDDYALSISVTTRKMRDCEVDGKDYFFKTEEEFHKMVKNNELLEHIMFVGNYYGTPRSYIENMISKGKTVFLEIEVNGALQVQKKFPDCVLIFLMPPTMEELKKRLIGRKTEDIETIEDRLVRAKDEIKLIDKYDYLVINDKVEQAVAQIEIITKAERMKPFRSNDVIDYFKGDNAKCLDHLIQN